MDNFPSFFPTTTTSNLSLNNVNIIDHHNPDSYTRFLNDKMMSSTARFAISPDHQSGLMAKDGSVSSKQDVDSPGNSLVSSESIENHQLMKMENSIIRKDNKKMKKPRYAFQTRSQVDILDDGYRWRKYGQKAVKNNRFPRSYYRCTYQGCNVKKQVQRLSKDEEVVVTTYEGMHSHPIEKSTDNFEHILTQMKIYTSS